MEQPELGKKIAELRKAKGLTQEELVETCNLSVRTLQRIESGEVAPRSYTIKVIFSALDYQLSASKEFFPGEFGTDQKKFKLRLEQFYLYVFDLFNLKTNTMKKVSILSVTLILIVSGLLIFNTESSGQSSEKLRLEFENNQKKILTSIEKGTFDSIMEFYAEDACMLPSTCGKDAIRVYFAFVNASTYKVLEYQTLSVDVNGDLAVEKYSINYMLSGVNFQMKGLAEWRNIKGKWVIVNDAFVNE
jgi:transcriptional regulator with XRE-family HTH domain